MSGGPQNFLSRLKKELKKYNLPPYEIINPNPKNLHLLEQENILKIGRLDGAIYYKITSLNLYNLFKQRRNISLAFIKWLPDSLTMFLNKPLNDYLNRNNRKVLQKSDIIVFQSKLSKMMQEKFVGTCKKPYKIILNGIPIEIFNPYREKVPLEGFPKLVITASFRPHKRLQDAIMIVNYLKKKYPNIKLHVIGDMDNLTKEYILTLDTSNCVFHGRAKSEDLPKFYNSCDVGLSPSLFDPCPNSVVEMMGCGLPVITTSASGAAELINVDNLIVQENLKLYYYEIQTTEKIPKIDIAKWCKAIEEVLDNRKYYSDYMLKRVEEELDIKIVAKKYANFIMEHQNAIGECSNVSL